MFFEKLTLNAWLITTKNEEDIKMIYKIALVTPSTYSHRTAEETIALGYLASILRKQNHCVKIVDGWLRDLCSEEIISHICQSGKPQIVGMSCYYSNLNQAKELLGLMRQRIGGIPIICGGYGPTFHDLDFLNAGFTVAVRGEAEHIIIPLIDSLMFRKDLSSLPGISYIKNGLIVRTNRTEPIEDLDLLPFPARDEMNIVKIRRNPAHVCTSRGCTGHCSFCSIYAFTRDASKRSKWRQRSIQNIIDELRYLYENFGISCVKFVDDSFLEPPRDEKWVAKFSDRLSRYNIPFRFRTQVRADRLTESIVRNLKGAGWFATSIGIENFSSSALKRMGKSTSVEDNLKALGWLHKYGIYTQMGMILFDYQTTVEELEKNYHSLLKYDWVITKGIFTEMFAAKGTYYAQRLNRLGILSVDASQNYQYAIHDSTVRRVYRILKAWHKSHSYLYDWVIDSISAPKVLPDEGYAEIYSLCNKLMSCDVNFLGRVLEHIKNVSERDDDRIISNAIFEHSAFYAGIELSIKGAYEKYGLVYDGAPNPFIV